MSNLDKPTVEGFGREWTAFDQAGVPEAELRAIFDSYFRAFPWHLLPDDAVGFDAGCGSGRWARFVAPRVGPPHLHCIDASADALAVAQTTLRDVPNCSFHHASIDDMPLDDASADFGYVLGVLHHLPDPRTGLAACRRKLKPGAPLLLYIYYAFDNRPAWYRKLWRVTDIMRRLVSRLPFGIRRMISDIIAALIYWPLARTAPLAERLGFTNWPLGAYRHDSFYIMRNDALDRFGTRLEHRFTRAEIEAMMHDAGFERITFSEAAPYWCAVGHRKP